MARYKPSELKAYLDSLGVSPKKALSQNFIIDGNILDKIIDTGEVVSGDIVLEIGPGPGALTEKLLEKGAFVIAIEKDRQFAKGLEGLCSKSLFVIEGDVLKICFEELGRRFLSNGKKLKIIANIPYKITTPIIEKIIEARNVVERAVLMMQEEVGRRCVAEKENKDFGSLSIFVQFYTHPVFAFLVSSHSFYPKPNVQSCVVSFTVKEELPSINEEFFFSVTRKAFSQRRKMLRASLCPPFDKEEIEKTLHLMHFLPTARPENFSLKEWVCFSSLLQEHHSPEN